MKSAKELSLEVALDTLKNSAKELFLDLYYEAGNISAPDEPADQMPLIDAFMRLSWAVDWGHARKEALKAHKELDILAARNGLSVVQRKAYDLVLQVYKFADMDSL